MSTAFFAPWTDMSGCFRARWFFTKGLERGVSVVVKMLVFRAEIARTEWPTSDGGRWR